MAMFRIIQSIAFLIIVMCVVLMIRTNAVAKYRSILINKIHKRYLENIEKGLEIDHRERWDEYKKITFDEMVWKFWKKVDSFYDEDKILK